eukprot:CAMPEP_0197025368 /NCGR_PEP_ID=MMETSP1384-20130603/5737_1 /TAXON_ID=29189 /ORGANISM="Ammonia sp." /LENGTH=214 /DNA_ID=CAMNT_0042453895 /DNA_START=38 /DNA_END=682 /DNA_ORIENTATION=+
MASTTQKLYKVYRRPMDDSDDEQDEAQSSGDDCKTKDSEFEQHANRNDKLQVEMKQDAPPKDKTQAVNFSGTWVLTTNSSSIDEYFLSEGWGYMMRKFVPMIAIKQNIKQDGNKFVVNVIVGPDGKFANETSTTMVGSGQEFEYNDKEGAVRGTAQWSDDKKQLICRTYRPSDRSRTYKEVRELLTPSIMVVTTTNNKGKTLVQNFELQAPTKY